jgi:gluconate 2-dehydrogenase gamma chain
MAVSRRTFLRSSGTAARLPATGAAVGQAAPRTATGAPARVAGPPYQFFQADESPFIEAAVVRLIPPDELGPSALEAGVPGFIDKQLAGAWGAGERLYRSGPWQPGAPTQGYQLPFTPAELFRTALRGIRADLQRAGRGAFEKLSGPEQDAYLTLLQTTPRDLGGVPSNVFFESLLGLTIEGYFSDPIYGGNVDMAAWKMIGFPGAYGAYYDLVDKHGQRFEGEPRSIGQSGRGTIRIMPVTPGSTGGADPHRHPGAPAAPAKRG